MIQMGQTVRDVVTKFRGVVTGRCEYITGCVQYLVCPRKAEKIQEGVWIDECRLVVCAHVKLVAVLTDPSGGPQANAPAVTGGRRRF